MNFQVHVHRTRCRKGAAGELQDAVCMGRPVSEARLWEQVEYVDTEEEEKEGMRGQTT